MCMRVCVCVLQTFGESDGLVQGIKLQRTVGGGANAEPSGVVEVVW